MLLDRVYTALANKTEGELAGILIYTRDKIYQEASFFDISGGVTGQRGLRYLVGMVKVEWLDAGVELPTYCDASRLHSMGKPTRGHVSGMGSKATQEHLSEWAKLRAALRETQIKEVSSELKAAFEKLALPTRTSLCNLWKSSSRSRWNLTEFEDILSWFLDALENATLRSILQKLRETNTAGT